MRVEPGRVYSRREFRLARFAATLQRELHLHVRRKILQVVDEGRPTGLLGVELDRSGRIPVSPDLRAPGFDNVYVAGDLASLLQDGKPVPSVAPAAKQTGAHVAHAIRARLAGRDAPAFRYRDYGNLATIGRMAAVVHLGKLKLSGAPAWWFWLLAHVFFLIGFRNRLVVLIDWAQAYWSYQRSARIILGA